MRRIDSFSSRSPASFYREATRELERDPCSMRSNPSSGNCCTARSAKRPFEAADYQLAAAALLVHIASVDGEFDAEERARLQHRRDRFGLEKARRANLSPTRGKASARRSIFIVSPAS